jgi:hypothetical protein
MEGAGVIRLGCKQKFLDNIAKELKCGAVSLSKSKQFFSAKNRRNHWW